MSQAHRVTTCWSVAYTDRDSCWDRPVRMYPCLPFPGNPSAVGNSMYGVRLYTREAALHMRDEMQDGREEHLYIVKLTRKRPMRRRRSDP